VRQSPGAQKVDVAALVRLQQTLDPFALAQQIDHALAAIYRLANHRRASARVDAAEPVDAHTASTRSLETRDQVFHSAHTPHRCLQIRIRSPELWRDEGFLGNR